MWIKTILSENYRDEILTALHIIVDNLKIIHKINVKISGQNSNK